MLPIMRRILISVGIVKSGLVGFYKFSEVAGSQVLTDYSGVGNHGQNGSLVGADTNDVTFDGLKATLATDDYINMTAGTFPTGAFTVQMGAKPSVATHIPLLGFASGASVPGIYINYNNQNTMLFLGANNYRQWSHTVVNGDDGNPHEYVFQMPGQAQADIGSSLHYTDLKTQVITNTVATDVAAAKDVYYIGRSKTYYLNGEIYYLLVYNRVLSLKELTQNNKALKKIMAGRGVVMP